MMKKPSIKDLIKEYFIAHTRQDLPHGPVVDWVEAKYMELQGRKPRDIWRSIRGLHQEGFLIKVRKGIYRYDPDAVTQRTLEDFTPYQRRIILERDGYKCVTCGRGRKDGVDLQVDHIKPRDLGGEATIDNGQTLCAEHNLRKKRFNQTETGKKMFILLYDLAQKGDDKQLMDFLTDVLETYESHGINDHIRWKR